MTLLVYNEVSCVAWRETYATKCRKKLKSNLNKHKVNKGNEYFNLKINLKYLLQSTETNIFY